MSVTFSSCTLFTIQLSDITSPSFLRLLFSPFKYPQELFTSAELSSYFLIRNHYTPTPGTTYSLSLSRRLLSDNILLAPHNRFQLQQTYLNKTCPVEAEVAVGEEIVVVEVAVVQEIVVAVVAVVVVVALIEEVLWEVVEEVAVVVAVVVAAVIVLRMFKFSGNKSFTFMSKTQTDKCAAPEIPQRHLLAQMLVS
jgi:hypothetical protein